MNILYNLEKNTLPHKNTIFLAGGTSRTDVSSSWRKEALMLLEKNKFDGNVIVPEPRNGFLSKEIFNKKEQISWEREMMARANVIIFWFDRCMDKHSANYLPCLTSNIEFGEWFKSEKVVLGISNESDNMDYIKEIWTELDKQYLKQLQSTIDIALKKLDRLPKIWFTSDTHFSQKRTMELSRRPFANIELMNRTLISCWNAKVYENDTIYHLGDFGEADVFDSLSGKKIKLLKGNYDTEDFIEKIKIADSRNRLEIIETGFTDDFNGLNLIHEPENKNNKLFNLFGHIHQLQLVKRYGLNVGCDNYGFFPIDLETIIFYKDAIQKHYDNNVFD